MSEDSNFKEIKIKKPKNFFEITKPVNSKVSKATASLSWTR